MNNKEYSKLIDKKAPASPIFVNCIWAFCVGGAICTLGQALFALYTYFGLEKTEAMSSESITLVFLGALFTGLTLFDKLAKHAGAGTLVPITGFANSVVAPALEYKSEGFVLGMSAKMFTIAGPVLVFGISASIIYGLILWIFRLF